MDEGAADIFLKQNDDNKNNGGEKVIQNPVQGIEAGQLGTDINTEDNRQAEQHLHRPSAFDQQHNPVDDECHQKYVEGIEQPSEIF